jgi:hypothetical protein
MPEFYDLVMAAQQAAPKEAPLPLWATYLITMILALVSTGSTIVMFLARRELGRRDLEIAELKEGQRGFAKVVATVEAMEGFLETDRRDLWSKVNETAAMATGHRDRCREIFVDKEVFDRVNEMRGKQDAVVDRRIEEMTSTLEHMRRQTSGQV